MAETVGHEFGVLRPDCHLFTVRAGVEIGHAMAFASLLLDQSMELSHAIMADREQCADLQWTVNFLSDVAKALIDSAVGGHLRSDR